jgi:hypothetical protein
MNFQEKIIARLPKDRSFIRMFAQNKSKSIIETRGNNRSHTFTLTKKPLEELFPYPVLVSVGINETYDDIYAKISKRFDLGLVKGVDYYNGSKVNPTQAMVYQALPVLSDSLGYTGNIAVFIRNESFGLGKEGLDCDLVDLDQAYMYRLMKVRTLLCSKVYTLKGKTNLFAENRLSKPFIELLMSEIKENFDSTFTIDLDMQFSRGVVVGLINDGLSDILLFQSPIGYEFFIRFSSCVGDLPKLEVNPNDNDNPLEGGSQGSSSGSDGEVSENPGGVEGEDTNSDHEVIIPNPSFPEEDLEEDIGTDEDIAFP